MPIPLILWGLGAVAVAGLGLGVKAACDNSEANDTNEGAQRIFNQAERKLEETRVQTNTSLESYGTQKLEAFEKKIGTFVNLYDQLKNVEISRSTELDNLQLGDFTNVSIADIKQSYNALTSITQGFTGGLAGGALAAYGAYTGAMAFGAASTGAAIGGLSGVAATNATLAWLGGGALSAGGAGMAGGMMVLGGLVAGPALLIFGGIFAAKASQKLSEAKSNKIKAREYEDEVEIVCDKLLMIEEMVEMASSILSKVGGLSRRANLALKNAIESSGTDYSTFSESEKDSVFKAIKYAQLIKAIVDKSILDEDGALSKNVNVELTKLGEALT